RGEPWIEDPTNTDRRFTRNRIRAELVPALEACFPAFRDTFTRSSTHAAQAQQLLLELAQQDLAAVGTPPQIRALQQLSSARQANVLRNWLTSVHRCTPSAAQLAELQRQLAACTTRGHRIEIKVGSGFVRRSNDRLDWYNPSVLAP
ncbi:MAG: TilS substrate-binding domain-containing protein, partial [Giesbergeria sp.]